jgi:hypothetical protein
VKKEKSSENVWKASTEQNFNMQKNDTMTQRSTPLQYGNAKQVSFEQERQETKWNETKNFLHKTLTCKKFWHKRTLKVQRNNKSSLEGNLQWNVPGLNTLMFSSKR